MRTSPWRRCDDESGQVLPLLLMLFVALLAVGLSLFKVGQATVLRSEAQTAADAAALGGAQAIRSQVFRAIAATGPVPRERLAPGSREALIGGALASRPGLGGRIGGGASDYAHRNGGRIVSLSRPGPFDVLVTVETIEALDDGQRSDARARARLRVTYLPLPPPPEPPPPPPPIVIDGVEIAQPAPPPPPPPPLDPRDYIRLDVRLVQLSG